MPRIDVVVETPISNSVRVKMLGGMFDVPAAEKSRLEWSFDAPIDDEPWSVGLIVGPSGSGKSTIAKALFGADFDPALKWGAPAVVDDFPSTMKMEQIAEVCSAVGFNTIPAWMRPFAVLSNGEQFRVALARRLLERDTVIVDEFTSVVDRQVAKIGSHAVQKYTRRAGKKFVAVSCHFDIEEWLQPDWVIEPATQSFRRRAVQPRPRIDCTISPVPYSTWRLFAPYHYMSGELHRSARCFGLFVGDRIAAFAAMLPRPVSNGKDRGTAIWGTSRLVTLPDFQGLGLAFVLSDKVGSLYAARGERVRNYPAHPALIRAHDRSSKWKMVKRPGVFSSVSESKTMGMKNVGGRPCAVFEYTGPAAPEDEARRVFAGFRGVS